MDISEIYTKKYLDRINLNKPFLEQDFIQYQDIHCLVPNTIKCNGIEYYFRLIDMRTEFIIRYRSESRENGPGNVETEVMQHYKPHIYEIVVKGMLKYIYNLAESNNEVELIWD